MSDLWITNLPWCGVAFYPNLECVPRDYYSIKKGFCCKLLMSVLLHGSTQCVNSWNKKNSTIWWELSFQYTQFICVRAYLNVASTACTPFTENQANDLVQAYTILNLSKNSGSSSSVKMRHVNNGVSVKLVDARSSPTSSFWRLFP